MPDGTSSSARFFVSAATPMLRIEPIVEPVLSAARPVILMMRLGGREALLRLGPPEPSHTRRPPRYAVLTSSLSQRASGLPCVTKRPVSST
jgi:hypothetical protein